MNRLELFLETINSPDSFNGITDKRKIDRLRKLISLLPASSDKEIEAVESCYDTRREQLAVHLFFGLIWVVLLGISVAITIGEVSSGTSDLFAYLLLVAYLFKQIADELVTIFLTRRLMQFYLMFLELHHIEIEEEILLTQILKG